MSMTKQEACEFLQDLAERLWNVPATYTDEGDIDRLKMLAELIQTDFGVQEVRIEEALQGIRGHKETMRSLLSDRDELLARVCEYADTLADRRQTEPWKIMMEIFGHGSNLSNALFQAYRRES